MTQQKLIAKIREKVIKACPDIIELKFGCKIKNKNGALDTIVTYSNYGNFTVVGSRICSIESDIAEIIGSPIGIAEILRTIENNTIGSFTFSISNSLFSIRNGRYLCIWNLAKDNLENQSLDTLEFLWELLK